MTGDLKKLKKKKSLSAHRLTYQLLPVNFVFYYNALNDFVIATHGFLLVLYNVW